MEGEREAHVSFQVLCSTVQGQAMPIKPRPPCSVQKSAINVTRADRTSRDIFAASLWDGRGWGGGGGQLHCPQWRRASLIASSPTCKIPICSWETRYEARRHIYMYLRRYI